MKNEFSNVQGKPYLPAAFFLAYNIHFYALAYDGLLFYTAISDSILCYAKASKSILHYATT